MTGMTKDYAIAILRRMQESEPFEPQINESAFDALEMAIQALLAQDTDVIPRKAAISAIVGRTFCKTEDELRTYAKQHNLEDEFTWTSGILNALDAVEELPSAQPEIIRCKDCKNWDTTWQNDWAKNYHYCPLIDGTRNGDWYCADAERRTDE